MIVIPARYSQTLGREVFVDLQDRVAAVAMNPHVAHMSGSVQINHDLSGRRAGPVAQ
ncbi:MAG: hypothetical protein WA484_09375 [Solirubrobacteraceae bacterium]